MLSQSLTPRPASTSEYASHIFGNSTLVDDKEIGLEVFVQQPAFSKLGTGYNEGVVETFAEIDRDLFEPVLVTGGFADLAIRANRDLGIAHTFAACEYFFDAKGRLSAFNLLPCDFEGKLDFIRLMLREYGLSDRDWVFVGDGANDVPIAKMAPVAIGYRPHPKLREVVHHTVFHFKEVLAILKKLPQYAK